MGFLLPFLSIFLRFLASVEDTRPSDYRVVCVIPGRSNAVPAAKAA